MNYYRGWFARQYNKHWHTFTTRTLNEVFPCITMAEKPVRALDVGCGTGILLKKIVDIFPEIELVGMDASEDMLAEAGVALQNRSKTSLVLGTLVKGEAARLPFLPATFDLITCTNVFHDLPDPRETLKDLRALLTPGGKLVLEDYARREAPFPWVLFEVFVRIFEGIYVRAYTLAEVETLCHEVGFQTLFKKSFAITRTWHGWLIVAT